MYRVSGMLFVNSNNQCLHLRGYPLEISKDINTSLPKENKYWFSIDQSTKCCGMFLTDTKEDIQVVLELPRDTYETAFDYMRRLKTFLDSLLKNIRIEKFIMEEVPPGKYKIAYSALKELKGAIQGWILTDPTFRGINPESIYPATWKSKVVDKTKGKNRNKSKRFIAEDICDINPLFKNYLGVSLSNNYDGFDAMGIYHGFKRTRYNESGARKIGGKMEYRHTPIAFFKYLPKELINDKRYLYYGFMDKILNKNLVKLEYNPEYTFYENIRLCSSNFDVAYSIITEKVVAEMLRWEFLVDYKPDHYFVMFVLRKSKLTDREIEYCSGSNYCLIAD